MTGFSSPPVPAAPAPRPCLLQGTLHAEALLRAQTLPRVGLAARETAHLLMLGLGAYTPLQGFMGEADWRRVLGEQRLADGTPWPIPVTASIDRATAGFCGLGDELALYDPMRDEVLGTMRLTAVYEPQPGAEARALYGERTLPERARRALQEAGEVYIAGPVNVLSLGALAERFHADFRSPLQARAEIASRHWQEVAAVDAAQPALRPLIAKALRACDGVLVLSPAGALHTGDFQDEDCTAQRLAEDFGPRVLVCPLPLARCGNEQRDAALLRLVAERYGARHWYAAPVHDAPGAAGPLLRQHGGEPRLGQAGC